MKFWHKHIWAEVARNFKEVRGYDGAMYEKTTITYKCACDDYRQRELNGKVEG